MRKTLQNSSQRTLPPDSTNIQSFLYKKPKFCDPKRTVSFSKKTREIFSEKSFAKIEKSSIKSTIKPILKESILTKSPNFKNKANVLDNCSQHTGLQSSQLSTNLINFKKTHENLNFDFLRENFENVHNNENEIPIINKIATFRANNDLYSKINENQNKQESEFFILQKQLFDCKQKLMSKSIEHEIALNKNKELFQKLTDGTILNEKLKNQLYKYEKDLESSYENYSHQQLLSIQTRQENMQIKIENEKLKEKLDSINVEMSGLKMTVVDKNNVLKSVEQENEKHKENIHQLCQLIQTLRSELTNLKCTNEDALKFLQKI